MRSEPVPGVAGIDTLILHGLGVEGRAALAWFLDHSACAILAIDRPEVTAALPAAVKAEPRLGLGTEQDFAMPGQHQRTVLYLRSPGIPPVNPVFTAIRQAGIAHTTPTGWWIARHAPAGTITITGTKGKSTTASLTAALLRWAGRDAVEMGNIGRTPFEAAPGPDTVCVFELSSYMMHDLPPADIFHVVTSLYTEHTDWHGSHAEYAGDKLRPFSFDPSAPGLIAGDVGRYRESWPAGVGRMEDVVPIEADRLALGGESLVPAALNAFFAAPSMLLALRAAAATCLARGLLDAQTIADALRAHLPGWRGLSCRQETLATGDGITWVDDALATVPEATLSALTRWSDRPVRLILGGKNRGQDFAALIAACAARSDVTLYLFDETGEAIAAQADSGRAVLKESLEAAIAAARADAAPGEAIVFSPAAPSSAQHGNYTVRSRIFRQAAGVAP